MQMQQMAPHDRLNARIRRLKGHCHLGIYCVRARARLMPMHLRSRSGLRLSSTSFSALGGRLVRTTYARRMLVRPEGKYPSGSRAQRDEWARFARPGSGVDIAEVCRR